MEVKLPDPFARQQLLARTGGSDVTGQATFASSAVAIVAVHERGYLVPLADGEATITATHGGASATAKVMVSGFSQPRAVDFQGEVVPLLSRYGCNAGGCHGKASGQNGFKLSLFGFDAAFDYEAITRRGRGRRISAGRPTRACCWRRRPAGAARRRQAARAGQRGLSTDAALDRRRARRPPPGRARASRSWRSCPRERVLQAGQASSSPSSPSTPTAAPRRDAAGRVLEQPRRRRRASMSDGLVTAREQQRRGGDHGPLHGPRRRVPRHRAARRAAGGDSRLQAAQLHRPAWPPTKWKKLGLRAFAAVRRRDVPPPRDGRPVRPAADGGRSASVPGRHGRRQARRSSIDRLLDSPDYPAYFALRWGSILRNSHLAGADQAAYAFHNWIKDMIARNRPYDEFVRGVVAAAGEWQDAPAINWYWQIRDDQLHQVTADTAQVFLGMRLQCAQLPPSSLRALGPGRLLRPGRLLHAPGPQELRPAAAVLRLRQRRRPARRTR